MDINEALIRIGDLEATLAEFQLTIKSLLAENGLLKEKLARFELKKTQSNSSIPSSKDENHKPKRRRKPSGRKPGGQSGHVGSGPKVKASADVVIVDKPNFCHLCGGDLSGAEVIGVQTTQVVDIELKPIVKEIQVHQLKCKCGCVHAPKAPSEPLSFGKDLTAFICYLNAGHYVSYKRLKEMIYDLFQIQISEGTINAMLKRSGEKAEAAYAFILEAVAKAPVVGADETGFRLNGKKGWFWTFQTPKLTYISAEESRGKKVLDKLFPDGLPHSILVSDRYAVYNKLPTKGKQICFAHLIREACYLEELEKTDWAKQFGQWLSDAFKFDTDREILQKRLKDLLAEELTKETPKTLTMLKSMRKNAHALTCFLCHPKVPPDNNASERAIRHVKTKTKVAGQFKTMRGANDYAMFRSLMDTARKNGQSPWGVFQSLAI